MDIDIWMTEPAADEVEAKVKEWFREFRRPAVHTNYDWLNARRLTCDYKGKRYRCIGASRLGDVWLTDRMDTLYGYQHRVDVSDCSNWAIEEPATAEAA